MYETYTKYIYEYLQTHLPLIEDTLSEIKSAVASVGDKIYPVIVLIAVLLIFDRFVKRGDLI